MKKPLAQPGGASHTQRDLAFGPPGYRVAYIPAQRGEWHRHYKSHSIQDITIKTVSTEEKLAEPLQSLEPVQRGINLSRCRVVSCSARAGTMQIRFGRTTYDNYLKSNEQIDTIIDGVTGETLRAKFLRTLEWDEDYLKPLEGLTNICGVGIFVITKDDYLVVTRHTVRTHVYPGRWTFSASGSIPWGAFPHPHTYVMMKSHEEIRHLVDPSNLNMFAFGIDARKLYFQFSFVERTDFQLAEIKEYYKERKKQYKTGTTWDRT